MAELRILTLTAGELMVRSVRLPNSSCETRILEGMLQNGMVQVVLLDT